MGLLLAGLSAQERLPLRTGWELAPEVQPGVRPDPEAWRAVSVPSSFEDVLGPTFDGVAWYRRVLDLRACPAGAQLRIEFHGAATIAEVFLNGAPVGRHVGAWTPFRVPLAAARRDGNDLLEVRLDEAVGHDTQGFHPIIQPHFGGLWRDVVLCVDVGPVLDRFSLLTFGGFDDLRVDAALIDPAEGAQLRTRLLDGARLVAEQTEPIADRVELRVPVREVRHWSPARPNLYRVELALLLGGRVTDRIVRQVGFREVAAQGRVLLWNRVPLQVRGMLHWGYEPPQTAPAPDPAVWRAELEAMRARGFNLVKTCLWIPPREFYEIADELGMLVWQEYPTWHPRFTPERKEALAQEFAEFHRYDRSHPSVAFRSLTCETGHGADLDVIRTLYDNAHASVPNTLVVDDSSWIAWNRIHDFWDDHPYGNNRPWPAKLRSFDAHIREHGEKPLLLGECITGDTWIDLAAWDAVHGRATPWWAPRCLAAQREFESWLAREHGVETLAALLPDSLDYVMRNRRYQIERLRMDLPHAGYVVSVWRDFTLARMGLVDHVGRAKWPPAAWAWQADRMLALDTAQDRRAFAASDLALQIAAIDPDPRAPDGTLAWRLEQAHGEIPLHRSGPVARSGTIRPELAASHVPRRLELQAEFTPTAAAAPPLAAQWHLWLLPDAPALPREVEIVETLTPELLDRLQAGGRAILRAGEQHNSLKTRAHQYYRGAPIAPHHPIHAALPRDFLLELQTFDLEGPRVLDWDALRGQIDPILALWDTHDLAEVRSFLLLAETAVGAGRLAVTTLDHDSPAGRYVLAQLAHHLLHGPPPRRAMSPQLLARLRATITRQTLPLDDWQIRFDGETTWHPIRAGSHWENQGFPHRNGVAFYRTTITLPPTWADQPIHAVFEGVDDSYECFLDEKSVGRHGDPTRDITVWLHRTAIDLTPAARPGTQQTLLLRVVDHRGAGGLWKPAFLTTGPIDSASDLVH